MQKLLDNGVRYDTFPSVARKPRGGGKVGRPSKIRNKVERDGVLARTLLGQSHAEIASDMGVSSAVVASVIRRATQITQSITPGLVPALKARIGDLLTLLAAQHATSALLSAETNPSDSAKSTWGAKMALEASRLADGSAGAGISVAMLIGTLGSRTVETVVSRDDLGDLETLDSIRDSLGSKIPLDKSTEVCYTQGVGVGNQDTLELARELHNVSLVTIPSPPLGSCHDSLPMTREGKASHLMTREDKDESSFGAGGSKVDLEFIGRWFENPELERELDAE